MNLLNCTQKITEFDDFKIIMLPTKTNNKACYTEYRVINKTDKYTTEQIMRVLCDVIQKNLETAFQ